MASNIEIYHRAERHSDRRQVASITLTACLMFLVYVFIDRNWGPFIIPLSTQLHISLLSAGLPYVAWSTGYLPGALIGGVMLDRYGSRLVLFVASLVILTGITAISLGLLLHFAPLLTLLIIAAGFSGIGGGVIDVAPTGLISHLFAQRRGLALNLFNMLAPLGGVVIGLIDVGLFMLFHNDPLSPLLFLICFILVAMLTLPAVPREYRVEVKTTQNDRRAPRLATLVPAIAVMALTSGIHSSLRTWSPAYLHVAYGQTASMAAALGSLSWVFALFSSLGAALLIGRIGAWRVLMLGVVTALCGLVVLLLSPTALLSTLALVLTSIGLSPIFVSCLTVSQEQVSGSSGAVAGILLFAYGISTAFCGWFFGFLLSAGGPAWAIVFSLVLVGSGGLMALSLRLK